jgi:hypothetical protein
MEAAASSTTCIACRTTACCCFCCLGRQQCSYQGWEQLLCILRKQCVADVHINSAAAASIMFGSWLLLLLLPGISCSHLHMQHGFQQEDVHWVEAGAAAAGSCCSCCCCFCWLFKGL